MKLVISSLESKDLDDFTNLARTTFVESYKSVDSAYYIKKHLAKYITLENLRKEFNTRRNHFFIARIDEEPVGFCKLVGDENEDHPFLIKHRSIELERLYVLKKHQHLGDFTSFLEACKGIGIGLDGFELMIQLIYDQVIDGVDDHLPTKEFKYPLLFLLELGSLFKNIAFCNELKFVHKKIINAI